MLGLERLCRRFLYLNLSLGVDSRAQLCYVTSVEYTVSCCNVVYLSRKAPIKLLNTVWFSAAKGTLRCCKQWHRTKRKHLHNGNSAALTSAALYAKLFECLFLDELRSSSKPRTTKATGPKLSRHFEKGSHRLAVFPQCFRMCEAGRRSAHRCGERRWPRSRCPSGLPHFFLVIQILKMKGAIHKRYA